MGTLNMLGLAKRVGARFLLTSTSEVYGDPLQHPQSESYWGNVNPIGECYLRKKLLDFQTVLENCSSEVVLDSEQVSGAVTMRESVRLKHLLWITTEDLTLRYTKLSNVSLSQ